MSKYYVIFEFRTYVDEAIEDYSTELDFVPYPGMSIWIAKGMVKFPKNMPVEAWFKIKSVDYLLKDKVFVAGLEYIDEYEVEEEK